MVGEDLKQIFQLMLCNNRKDEREAHEPAIKRSQPYHYSHLYCHHVLCLSSPKVESVYSGALLQYCNSQVGDEHLRGSHHPLHPGLQGQEEGQDTHVVHVHHRLSPAVHGM